MLQIKQNIKHITVQSKTEKENRSKENFNCNISGIERLLTWVSNVKLCILFISF